MPANIVINQATKPAGVAGKFRTDLSTGLLVTCTNSTVEGSYAWVLEDVPIRSALVRGTTGAAASFTFTPDVKGTYRVSLVVNGSPFSTDAAVLGAAVRSFGSKTLGWRYLAADEEDEDNSDVDPSLNMPFDVNVRGWATEKDLQDEQTELAAYEAANAVTVSPGPGSDNFVRLDPATGRLDASVIPNTTEAPYSQVTGCNNEFESILTTERIVGGFTFDGSIVPPTQHVFRMIGIFVNGAASGDARLRLYDMGAVGVPAAGLLRAEVAIPNADGGATTTVSQVLVPDPTPVASGEILNTERQYELRVYLDSVTPGDTMTVIWAGIVTQ